jgi:multidrug transporter EmrE-like cation transporter
MTTSVKLLILGAVTLSAAGQLLLKSGARHLLGLGRVELLLAAARDAQVVAALAAWSASTICWLYVLRAAPLSRAYGLTSLSYVIVPLASVWLFGEQVRRMHVLGMALIVVGIACVMSGD